jgi:Uma2 family endonuclease
MSASLKLPVHMTVEEFLEWDPNDDQRYELVDGMPHAMAPGTTTHGFLQSELGAVLRNHLRERRSNCEVLTNPGVVPRLLADDNYRIPDLAVTCSPLTTGQLILPDPVLIIEILSPSNRAETWANVRAYTSIPSVQEILVLHSTAVAAELLRRMSDGGWPERTEQITSTLKLDSIGFQMPLADLYARTPLAR